MMTAKYGRVRRLTDEYETGFAGFGYGGDRLFVVCLVDCFDPTRYFVRADSWEEAHETATECLCHSVELEEVNEELVREGFPIITGATVRNDAVWDSLERAGFGLSPSGRTVWHDSVSAVNVTEYCRTSDNGRNGADNG